jgi:hypothetical protein
MLRDFAIMADQKGLRLLWVVEYDVPHRVRGDPDRFAPGSFKSSQ